MAKEGGERDQSAYNAFRNSDLGKAGRKESKRVWGKVSGGKGGCLGVQSFQVGGEVEDALRVQELADDKGRLQVADGGQVLLHGAVVVVLGVQVAPHSAPGSPPPPLRPPAARGLVPRADCPRMIKNDQGECHISSPFVFLSFWSSICAK